MKPIKPGAQAIGALGLAILCIAGCSEPPPADTEVRAYFEHHQADFDSLAALATADTQLVQVINYGGSPDVFVHEAGPFDHRVREEELRGSWRAPYPRLVARAGVRRVSRSKEGRVWITTYSNGKASKGVVFSREPMPPLRRTLDDVDESTPIPYGYVQVAAEWYLWVAYRMD